MNIKTSDQTPVKAIFSFSSGNPLIIQIPSEIKNLNFHDLEDFQDILELLLAKVKKQKQFLCTEKGKK